MDITIKFRAWDIDTKHMYFPDKDCYIDKLIETVSWKPMQCIGLKDVNKKEIFIGDVVEWDDNSNGKWRRRCVVGKEKAHYTLVGYHYDVNNPTKKNPIDFKFGQFIYENDGELEVIGNIYENPELMK